MRIACLAGFCALLCLPLPTALAADLSHGRMELVPRAWAPSLDDVRDYLEERAAAESAASQRSLVQTTRNLADVADAQLFIAYVQLMQALDAKAQARLLDEQRRWLSRRDDAASLAATSGGTLGPLEYADAFGKATQERLAELRKRLQQRQSAPQRMK